MSIEREQVSSVSEEFLTYETTNFINIIGILRIVIHEIISSERDAVYLSDYNIMNLESRHDISSLLIPNT
jgi:hypothetical protein